MKKFILILIIIMVTASIFFIVGYQKGQYSIDADCYEPNHYRHLHGSKEKELGGKYGFYSHWECSIERLTN